MAIQTESPVQVSLLQNHSNGNLKKIYDKVPLVNFFRYDKVIFIELVPHYGQLPQYITNNTKLYHRTLLL